MADLTLKQLVELIMKQAQEKGFGTTPREISMAEKMALVHTEVSEAYQAYRRKNLDGKDGFKEELGDIIQRVLHLCGIFEVDIEQEILKKLQYNKERVWNWDQINEDHA